MTQRLHPNAAIRCLRNALATAQESHAEIADAMNDPRVPQGALDAELGAICREISELEEAIDHLELILEVVNEAPGHHVVYA